MSDTSVVDLDYATRRTVEMTVTPKMSADWLTLFNDGNRHFRKACAQWFRDVIDADLYAFTHQGIAFYVGPRLADGQHRLGGCAMGAKPIRTLVTFGLPDDETTKGAIDSKVAGPRTDADVLTFNGYPHAKYSVQMIRMFRYAEMRHVSRPLLKELRRLVDENATAIDWCYRAIGTQRGLGSVPIASALTYAYPTDPIGVSRFVAKCKGEVSFSAMDPVDAFLRKIRELPPLSSEESRLNMFLLTLSAIDSEARGKSRSFLRPAPGAFAAFMDRRVRLGFSTQTRSTDAK